MTHSALSRAVAAATVTTFVAIAAATTASAEEVTAANLAFDVAPGVLTLPAGDGVRDETQFTISSDIATEVSLVVRSTDSSDVVATLPAVTLAAATPAVVDLDLTGLDRGNFEVYATPTDGESIVTALTVGSGEPSDVSMSLSAGTIFTWAGASPRTSVATVSATDETGLAVPFHGTVTAAIGGKAYSPAIASTTGDPATVNLPSSKFGYGTGTVVARISGPTEGSYTSDVQSLKVLATAVSSVAVTTSSASVYPYKDSFYDTVKITVTPKTTTGAPFASTGSVKITRSGKTVASWSLTSSAARSVSWDGKVAGKIVPGTYTVTVTIKGPEGSTRTASKTVTVKSSKLVTKTKTVTYKASSIMKYHSPLDYYEDGYCVNYTDTGEFECDSYDAYYVEDVALMAQGYAWVPSDVQSAQKYGSASVKVYMNLTAGYGTAAWSYDTVEWGTAKVGAAQLGKRSLGSLSLPSGSSKVHITIALGEYSWIVGDKFTFVYSYKVLQ